MNFHKILFQKLFIDKQFFIYVLLTVESIKKQFISNKKRYLREIGSKDSNKRQFNNH